jgi:hypothetical protein
MRIINILLFSTLILFSCGEGNKKPLDKIQVTLITEGPVYNGPNTATGKWKPESGAKVRSVKFTSVTISGTDTTLSGLAGNLVLQMAAPNAEMKKIAFFKGNASGNSLTLQLAEEQDDLKDFFKGQEITFVVDYDFLPEELNQNLSFNLEFNAELATD